MLESKIVGKVIRIEVDDDGSVRMVMEITDVTFKDKILHSKDYQDIISLKGKDVMIVMTKSKGVK